MSLLEAARRFEAALAAFDPGVVSVEDAGRVVEVLARVGKRCDTMRVRASARVTEVEGRRAIHRMARQRGESASKIRRELETVEAAAEIPELSDALDRGELSLAQGAEIAKTEAEVPGSARDLIETAKARGLAGVRDEGRRRRQSAMDEDELQERRRQARGMRHRFDELGMSEFTFTLLPEVGERLRARLEHHTRVAGVVLGPGGAGAIAARMAGGWAPSERSEGGGRVAIRPGPQPAHPTGHPDEPCHLVGGSRVPVEVVKAMARDALLSVVLDDGQNVDTIARYGRHLPAALRILLDVGEPPQYLDAMCVDCHHRYRLQIDHIDPIANGGLTQYDNLARRCPPCHTHKTQQDRQAGLLTGVGAATGGAGRGAGPP